MLLDERQGTLEVVTKLPVTNLFGGLLPCVETVVLFAKARRKCGSAGFPAPWPSQDGVIDRSNSVVLNLEIVPSGGLAFSGDNFGCYNLGGATGIYWVEIRDAD